MRVVKSFNVVRHTACGVFVRVVYLLCFLGLVALEERFHRCVVVAVPAAAHALNKPTFCQASAEMIACELGATIAVNDQTRIWLAKSECLIQCPDHQFRIHVSARLPADNLAGMQVNECTEVSEAFLGWDVGDVR